MDMDAGILAFERCNGSFQRRIQKQFVTAGLKKPGFIGAAPSSLIGSRSYSPQGDIMAFPGMVQGHVVSNLTDAVHAFRSRFSKYEMYYYHDEFQDCTGASDCDFRVSVQMLIR